MNKSDKESIIAMIEGMIESLQTDQSVEYKCGICDMGEAIMEEINSMEEE